MSEAVDSLKQRLVGAFVIVTLAIIFLPMIFDKPHHDQSVVITPIPPKPEFKTIEISRPVKPEFRELEVDKSGKVVESVASKSALNQELTNDKTKQEKGNTAASTKTSSDSKSVSKSQSTQSNKAKVDTKLVATNKAKHKDPKSAVDSTKASAKTSKPKVSNLPIFKNIWMVQLGTFGNANNAYKLRDKLRADGFDGHTKTVKLNGKKAIKVFTGPFVKKREAQKVKKRLDKKYKLDSRVVYFDS